MKLLDTLIKFGNGFQSLSNVGKYAVIVGLVIFAFDAGSCHSDDKIKQFVVKYEQLQKEASSAKLFADSAKNKIAVLTDDVKSKDDVIKKLTISVEFRETQRKQLKNDLVELKTSLANAKDTAELVIVQAHMIDNLNRQLNVADSTANDLQEMLSAERYKVTKLDSALALANARGDRLQVVVDSVIKLEPPKPPTTWISKKTIGAIGFVSGVLVGDYLARR